MRSKISPLAMKFVLGFVMLGVLICVTSSVIGYKQYKSVIEKQYNDTAYDIAGVALDYTDVETLNEYIEVVKGFRDGTITHDQIDKLISEKRYIEVSERLALLRKNMGANDIYIIHIDTEMLKNYGEENWKPLLYVFDCYTDPAYSYVLGNSGAFNPKYISEAAYIMETGNRADSYFISQGDYGYNTTALLPINYEGETIGVVGVEVPMTTIESALRQYIIYAVMVTIILIILFIAAYMIYLYRRVIMPISKVTEEAKNFTQNQNQISESLANIKTKDEIQFLAQSILKMENDINDYILNITKITADKERIGAELDVARHIQASMLPCIFPAFPDRKEIDIYATMNPAKEVGGDFYDFFMVDERHLAIVMADVSGKGVPAALFMVIGKTLIKDHTQPDRDLGEVFTKVNNLLCESNSQEMFITAFEGVLDLVTGEFNFVNAGHEMPFICKAGGNFEPYKIKPGFVLAGMEDMRYRAGSMVLEVGDKIFQYTDGVTEATNAQNELYGMARLGDILNSVKDKNPNEILPAIKCDIDRFVAEAPQFDDITMLCLEYKEKMIIEKGNDQ